MAVYPEGGLILSGNTLYGTAEEGGSSDNGTVFAVSTDGTGFTNLYSFSAYDTNDNNYDGANPDDGLILSGNTLYGTAYEGGSSRDGTVFAVNTNGTGFTTLHIFSATDTNGFNSDGSGPAGLILSGNTLYGTTYYGGSSGDGTVFAVNTDGIGFTTLYSFSATNANGFNSDGAGPDGLILSGNTLFGTTYYGGGSGDGTVFSINTDGTGFTTLHSFSATDTNGFNSDGAGPSGLIIAGNTLYGTTYYGGSFGAGTVFFLILPARSNVPVQPGIANLSISGANLVLNGINGQSGGTYYVLTSTNVAVPLSQWTPVATNVLGTSGNFTVTVANALNPNIMQRFYILQTQ
jgi:uncharacterized repeat protein (TIGR03803 family)